LRWCLGWGKIGDEGWEGLVRNEIVDCRVRCQALEWEVLGVAKEVCKESTCKGEYHEC